MYIRVYVCVKGNTSHPEGLKEMIEVSLCAFVCMYVYIYIFVCAASV